MPKVMDVPAFSAPGGGEKLYARFSGIDLSTDETQIADSRSPEAVNVISDEGGFPERRVGWRTLHKFSGCISGIFPFEGKISRGDILRTSWRSQMDGARRPLSENPGAAGVKRGQGQASDRDALTTGSGAETQSEDSAKFIVHAGGALYLYDQENDTATEIKTGLLEGARTQGFYFNGKLYLLTGREYLVYDGQEVKAVKDAAYVPTTSYGAKPTGGGKAYERVNLLTSQRKNKFTADGSSTVYTVDTANVKGTYKIDKDSKVKVWIDGTEKTDGFTVNYEKGQITFTTAPPKPKNESTDNVEIQFSFTSDAENAQGPADVEKCRVFALFGLNSENRVFLSGNPDAPNKEIWSGLADPSYFPDLNYALIGSSDFKVMCFVKNQDELIIVKEDNRQEGTLWHQTAETLSDGTASFPIKAGLTGYGAVSHWAAANLNDDPLYLSPRGVYAPTMTFAYNYVQRQLVPRSRRVNQRLTKQAGLQDAVAACWRGWYVLCLDGVAYVADGNQPKESGGYEWYYWTGIPAFCLRAHEQALYFGTEDGRFCRFNDDMIDEDNNILMRAYNDDGRPIEAVWCTKLDTMGSPMRLKTMPKRGSGVHLKAYTRSTVDIYIRTEADHGKFVRKIYADRLNFNDIDFDRFTFSTVLNNLIPLRTKKKKWKAIQIMLKSDAVNEGFGVHSVVVRYLYAGYAKR